MKKEWKKERKRTDKSAPLPVLDEHTCFPTRKFMHTSAFGPAPRGWRCQASAPPEVVPVAIELVGRQQVDLDQGLGNTRIADPKGEDGGMDRLTGSISLPI